MNEDFIKGLTIGLCVGVVIGCLILLAAVV